jgi:hypothetical protein
MQGILEKVVCHTESPKTKNRVRGRKKKEERKKPPLP